MSFETPAELLERLPSRKTDALSRAIGRTLVDVRRMFTLDPERFHGAFPDVPPEAYFARNVGPVEFLFDGGVSQRFSSWPEQLSLVVEEQALTPGELAEVHSLRDSTRASERLKKCLGRRCSDVRIWTYLEDIDTEEAKQAGVSYVFGADELVYCVHIHGEIDDDCLVFRDDIAEEAVARVFSIADQRFRAFP